MPDKSIKIKRLNQQILEVIMKKTISTIIIAFFLAGILYAQENSKVDSLIIKGKTQMMEAFDSWNFEKMNNSRAYFERLLSIESEQQFLIHYYIGFIDLRISYSLMEDNKKKALEFIDDGISHLEKTIQIKDDFAEGYALLSSLLGNKIGMKPILGMTLGMKSGQLISRAFGIAPENPRISLIAGESAYYTPKLFGGGKKKAMEHLNNAIAFFQTFTPENRIYPSWGYDEAYAYKGMIFTDQELWDEAKKSFEKGLEINPDNSWIKMALMKKLEEKMKAEFKKK